MPCGWPMPFGCGSAARGCDHLRMNDEEPALSLLVIRAADLEASKAFYAKLGVRFQTEQHGQGPVHLSSTLGPTVFELYPSDAEGHAPVRLGLVVGCLDSVVSEFDGSAVKVLDREGTRVIVAVDPDGNKLELTERALDDRILADTP